MDAARTHPYAISSDLTGAALDAVFALWDELEVRFGMREARTAGRPHVTYVVGEPGEPELLLAAAAQAARRIEPFTLELDGVGVFEGESPVVYLRVVRHREL